MNKKSIMIAAAVLLEVLLSACGDNAGIITGKDTEALSNDTNENMINNEQTNTYRQISMDEAVAMMAQETGYIILDVRRPDEFATGHIPGAINIPNESIGENDITELPDKEQRIYVYCRSGNRSKQASAKLVNFDIPKDEKK